MSTQLPEDFSTWFEARFRDPQVATELALCHTYEQARQAAEANRRRELPRRVDAHNLSATGWGIVFSRAADSRLRILLRLLIARRKQQAKARFRLLIREPDESGRDFLRRHGATPGTLNPDRLPYYLLLAGGPEEIPFEFQYHLSINHAVGRIAFDDLEDYERYARAVVAAETKGGDRPRRATLVSVENGDRATGILTRHLVNPLEERLPSQAPGWQIEVRRGDDARKRALPELLGGADTPAFLLAACHGLRLSAGDPRQTAWQGALLCQDWRSGKSTTRNQFFHAGDVPTGGGLQGLIMMMMACYGAGTPVLDNFPQQRPPNKKPLAEAPEDYVLTPKPFISRLPQRLLGGGALAVVGHVDRGWTLSFAWPLQGQMGEAVESLEDSLQRLFAGYRLGHALRPLYRRYCALAAQLSEIQERKLQGVKVDTEYEAMLWTALNDARNVVTLGDPAVYLRGQREEEKQKGRFRGSIKVSSGASTGSTEKIAVQESETVVDGRSVDGRSVDEPPTPSKNQETTPDLEIRVRCLPMNGQNALTYALTARDLSLGLNNRDFGPVVLQLDPQAFFHKFFSSINSNLTLADSATRVDLLNAKGATLTRALLPRDLEEVLWSLHGRVTTVQVTSEEGWIPWEMLRIQGSGGPKNAFFLAEAFALTRWLRNCRQRLHLPLQRLGLVMSDRGDLPALTEEAVLLENLFPSAKRVEASYQQVTEHLAQGACDVWHFMGHGVAPAENPEDWAVLLDDQELTPDSLHGQASSFATGGAPLFFLNACHSGRGAQSLTSLGGWAAQLLELGAGAFVGSSWETQDDVAKELARIFYEGLLSGIPIGEAMRRARLAVREALPGDPSWLAYTVFAHPGASLSELQPACLDVTVEPALEPPLVKKGLRRQLLRPRSSTTIAAWFRQKALIGVIVLFLVVAAFVESTLILPGNAAEVSIINESEETTVPVNAVEPGKVGIGVLDEDSGKWLPQTSRLVATIMHNQMEVNTVALGNDFLEYAKILLAEKMEGEHKEGHSFYGAEYYLLVTENKNFISTRNNIIGIQLSLNSTLINAKNNEIISRTNSYHVGAGISQDMAMEQATERCLPEITQELTKRLKKNVIVK